METQVLQQSCSKRPSRTKGFTLDGSFFGLVKSDPELDIVPELTEADTSILLEPVCRTAVQPASCIKYRNISGFHESTFQHIKVE